MLVRGPLVGRGLTGACVKRFPMKPVKLPPVNLLSFLVLGDEPRPLLKDMAPGHGLLPPFEGRAPRLSPGAARRRQRPLSRPYGGVWSSSDVRALQLSNKTSSASAAPDGLLLPHEGWPAPVYLPHSHCRAAATQACENVHRSRRN